MVLSAMATLYVTALSFVVPCDDPAADPWVVDFRDRTVAYNEMYAFAVERSGEPVSCEGEVLSEFDGARYGILRMGFGGGVELTVETMPIETSTVTLTSASGFEDEAPVLEALRTYAAGVGVDIDWDTSETETDGDAVVRTYRDPEPGLNASARVVRVDGVLRSVGFSMAL